MMAYRYKHENTIFVVSFNSFPNIKQKQTLKQSWQKPTPTHTLVDTPVEVNLIKTSTPRTITSEKPTFEFIFQFILIRTNNKIIQANFLLQQQQVSRGI